MSQEWYVTHYKVCKRKPKDDITIISFEPVELIDMYADCLETVRNDYYKKQSLLSRFNDYLRIDKGNWCQILWDKLAEDYVKGFNIDRMSALGSIGYEMDSDEEKYANIELDIGKRIPLLGMGVNFIEEVHFTKKKLKIPLREFEKYTKPMSIPCLYTKKIGEVWYRHDDFLKQLSKSSSKFYPENTIYVLDNYDLGEFRKFFCKGDQWSIYTFLDKVIKKGGLKDDEFIRLSYQ